MSLSRQHSAMRMVTFVCAMVLSAITTSIGCELKPEEKDHALSLGFDAFDQSSTDSPWRELASVDGCYKESAELIDYYLSNKAGLRDNQVRNLNFHAGQMYAMSGDAERSIERFKESLWDGQPENFPINWNAYVIGTISYLMRDRNRFDVVLDTFKRELTDGDDPDFVNFTVLRAMGRCWEDQYQDIIQGKCEAK